MKTKKNKEISLLVCFLILCFFLLLGTLYLIGKKCEKEQTAGPQANHTEDSIIISDNTDEETSEKREGIFLKRNFEKQKRTNTDLKGGSKTLEIIKQEDNDDTGGDTDEAPEYDMLPGIW